MRIFRCIVIKSKHPEHGHTKHQKISGQDWTGADGFGFCKHNALLYNICKYFRFIFYGKDVGLFSFNGILKTFAALLVVGIMQCGIVVPAVFAKDIDKYFHVKQGEVFEVVLEVDWSKGEYYKLLSSKNDNVLRLESQEFYKPGWGGHKNACQVIVLKALQKGMTRARLSCHNQKYYDRKVAHAPKYRIVVNVT